MGKIIWTVLSALAITAVGCTPAPKSKDLPRGEATPRLEAALDEYMEAIGKTLEDTIPSHRQDVHSIMIVKNGKVVAEKFPGTDPGTPHILNSVSKTFTATAVGIAIAEGKLSLSDKIVDFFPDELPAELGENLPLVTVEDLLTMTGGHDVDPTAGLRSQAGEGESLDWAEYFLSRPFTHKPGTFFCYNTLGTYMLSAIVQKVTGEKIVDYLTPRLFEPLGIDKPRWEESPQGINCGGFGLYLKTEDLAKMGQLFLRKGEWNGRRILPEQWVEAASSYQVSNMPEGATEETVGNPDWVQGYGYQMWRCRHGAYRADGANGQYIIVLPDKEAVIAITSDLIDMQAQLDLVWKYLLPALD